MRRRLLMVFAVLALCVLGAGVRLGWIGGASDDAPADSSTRVEGDASMDDRDGAEDGHHPANPLALLGGRGPGEAEGDASMGDLGVAEDGQRHANLLALLGGRDPRVVEAERRETVEIDAIADRAAGEAAAAAGISEDNPGFLTILGASGDRPNKVQEDRSGPKGADGTTTLLPKFPQPTAYGRGEDRAAAPSWPPSGGEKAPAPPAVQRLMEKMVSAWNRKDDGLVEKLFVRRTTFLVTNDCDLADTVDRVLDGAKQAATRAQAEHLDVAFGGFGEGYLIDQPKGESWGGCRAKADLVLYIAQYGLVRSEPAPGKLGEVREAAEEHRIAHFMRFNGVWFFVRL